MESMGPWGITIFPPFIRQLATPPEKVQHEFLEAPGPKTFLGELTNYSYEGFHKRRYPKNGWFKMENPIC